MTITMKLIEIPTTCLVTMNPWGRTGYNPCKKLNYFFITFFSTTIIILINHTFSIMTTLQPINIIDYQPININWSILSVNPNPIIDYQPINIDWSIISINPNTIEINWSILSVNPNIFDFGPYYDTTHETYDYDAMRQRCLIYAEELIANRFHPKNCEKWIHWGFDDMALE